MALRAADFSHPRLHNVQVDLLDADATAQAGAEIAARFPVSHVIHNAGVIWPNPVSYTHLIHPCFSVIFF